MDDDDGGVLGHFAMGFFCGALARTLDFHWDLSDSNLAGKDRDPGLYSP